MAWLFWLVENDSEHGSIVACFVWLSWAAWHRLFSARLAWPYNCHLYNLIKKSDIVNRKTSMHGHKKATK
ncbi:MAG: hypothetical protein WC346_20150 [Methanogenium sp.]